MALIYPECYIERVFCSVVYARGSLDVGPRDFFFRLKVDGYSDVFNKILKSTISPAIGLIDKPGVSSKQLAKSYYNKFKVIDSSEYVLHKHVPGTKHYLCEIKLGFEEWLLQVIPISTFTKFNLPTNVKDLKSRTGPSTIEKDSSFRDFLAYSLQTSQELQTLESWLTQHFE